MVGIPGIRGKYKNCTFNLMLLLESRVSYFIGGHFLFFDCIETIHSKSNITYSDITLIGLLFKNICKK